MNFQNIKRRTLTCNGSHLTEADLFGFVGFTFLQAFTDARNDLEARVKGVACLFTNQLQFG